MIEAYLDESGLDGKWPVVCVGGYAADHDAWTAFQESWQVVLAKANIDCFHATSHPNLWGPMLEHIDDFGMRGVLVTVSADHYKRKMSHGARSTFGNAYATCAFSCALKIAERAKADGHGPVAVVIEDGQPNVQYVARTLEMMIGDDEYNIASVTVAKKRDFMPLQAADLLAHCAGTHQVDWLKVMANGGPGKLLHGHMTAQMLRGLSATIEEVKRQYRHRKQQAKSAARLARRASIAPAPPASI